MIRSIRMRNFKCFEDQGFGLGSLTLLSGLNGTGKSSVLQALLLLRQSYQQGLLEKVGLSLNGDLVQLGKAKDVFYEWARNNEFGFDIEFADETRAAWRFEYDREADVVKQTSASFPESSNTEPLFGDSFQYICAERTGPRPSSPVSDYQVRQHHQLGVRGEFTPYYLSLFGESRIPNESLAHPGQDAITLKLQTEAWLGEVSPGVRIELQPYESIDQVGLQYSFRAGNQVSNPYRSTNVGFGITYTLPILVALLGSPSRTLVLLENPEAHLHPKGQVRMGELLARAAQCGVQVLVETHSDHILNGVRIAIRRHLLYPEQLRLYFLSQKEESDQISVHVLSPKVDEDGRIDQWPEGFFDEWDKSLEELLRP